MNWLNPIAFWGLTALAIPIFIHLWSKNKTKEMAFGSIRFLKESSTLQSKKIQLSELPLLLIRLLILILIVLLMAKWVSYHKLEKQDALLLGTNIKVPEAYSGKEIPIFRTTGFKENPNHWLLLSELSQQNPEIDSLIYINDFKNTDFTGAIPKLNFHLEVISSNQKQTTDENWSLDTLLIHFNELPPSIQKKFNKALKTSHLYTKKKVNFKPVDLESAQLIFTDSPKNQNVNQIVLSDTISVDYAVYKNHKRSILYLNENWLKNPLNEDLFLSITTEFIAQIAEPNYLYSSFDSVYSRKSETVEEVQKAKAFDIELLWGIVLLMILERYFSFRKKYA